MPKLEDILLRLQEFEARIQDELKDLNDEQLSTTESKGKWSIAQVLEHLRMASISYVEQLEEGLEKSSESAKEQIESSLMGSIFIKFVDKKTPFKVPAPKMFQPKKVATGNESIGLFLEFQKRLIAVAAAYRHRNFNEIYVYSPLSRIFKFKAGESLMIIADHQERHLHQIKRIIGKLKN